MALPRPRVLRPVQFDALEQPLRGAVEQDRHALPIDPVKIVAKEAQLAPVGQDRAAFLVIMQTVRALGPKLCRALHALAG